MRMLRLFAILFFLPLVLSAQKKTIADTTLIRPNAYLYAEGFGPAGFFSLNGEKLLLKTKQRPRSLYGRAGFQWLPDLTARYTVALLGGFNFESGEKSWSRDFGAGVTFLIDHYTWKKTDTLSTHCDKDNCKPTLRWGPYLSLGMRYRFNDQIFCSFEFTPVALSGDEDWTLVPSLGASVGFWFK